MKKFKQKKFTESTGFLKKTKDLVKRSPILPVSVASLGVASTNLYLNNRKKNQDMEFQKNQLESMNGLTNALTKVDKSLKDDISSRAALMESNNSKSKKTPKKSNSWFRRNLFSNTTTVRKKSFSILSDTVKGATLGASIGSLGTLFTGKINNSIKGPTIINKDGEKILYKDKVVGRVGDKSEVVFGNHYKFKKKYNNLSDFEKRVAIIGAGTIIGAALGALVGLIKESDKAISRSRVDNRLMNTVIDNLKKLSFKEGSDFTRDPKMADRLKTKICIVITRTNGDLRVLINTVSDSKLRSLTNQITKNIKNNSVITNKALNNYNEITISTISDGSADAGLVTGICEQFIHAGYPIYLVEVG